MSKRINLLEGNITSSLTKLALPLMGMSLLQMTYNLVDMFWIGKLGAGAVASVGTGGLLTWFAMGLHTLSQLGGQVYVAQNLGAKEYKKAGSYAKASIFLTTVISLILAIILITLTSPIISFFNLGDPTVIKDAENYIIVTGGLIFFPLIAKLLTALITSTGDSKAPFFAATVGLVLNMILDPILIFGYFGLPALGVVGAGVATTIAQAVVFAFLFAYAKKDKTLFKFVDLKTLPNFTRCKEILKLSFPVACQASLFPLISMYISRLVADFSYNAVAVQRVGSQIESISWMTTEGYAIAVNSFIAQNYGARNINRVKEGFFKASTILIIYGLFASALLGFFGEPIFALFLDDPVVLDMGKDYMIIIAVSQVFMCLEILSGNSMNALGKTFIPSAIGITFTGIRIPLALILIGVLGLNGIWWTITLSSILKGILLYAAILIFLRNLDNR